MFEDALTPRTRLLRTGYLFLFAGLLSPFCFGFFAFTWETLFEHIIADTLFAAICVFGVWAVARDRRILAIGMAIAACGLLARWGTYFWPSQTLVALSLGLQSLFFLFLTAALQWKVLRDRVVDTQTIIGAICVYMTLIYFFAMLYAFMEAVAPGSFVLPPDVTGAEVSVHQFRQTAQLLYFSAVTLASVGFGDVVPNSEVSRGFSALEAIAGQLYLAVLITRLVGIQAARAISRHMRA